MRRNKRSGRKKRKDGQTGQGGAAPWGTSPSLWLTELEASPGPTHTEVALGTASPMVLSLPKRGGGFRVCTSAAPVVPFPLDTRTRDFYASVCKSQAARTGRATLFRASPAQLLRFPGLHRRAGAPRTAAPWGLGHGNAK